MHDDEVQEVAGVVGDGSDLDWDAIEASAADDLERGLLAELRVVQEVARIHHASTSTHTAEHPTHWGHLEIRERIAGGTYGQVYRAWDPRLEREVALKLLRCATDRAGEIPYRAGDNDVIHEARRLARVSHPNVITVYGAERREGCVGLWMELVNGQTLEEVLRTSGPLGIAEATLVGATVCRALAAVHRTGLVHGDVKCQNVMRERGGRILLMDFGSVREHGSPLTDAGAELAGTPLYLAPEVIEGRRASKASDIYSVGVLLFHVVTNSYPVAGETLEEVADHHRRGPRVSLHDARPDASEAFALVVARALSPDPAARFESAGQMAAALEAALRWRPAPAPVVSPQAWRTMLGSVAAAVLLAGVWIGARALGVSNAAPQYERLTFSPGRVSSARFAPGQRSVVYTGAWGDRPQQVFMTASGTQESRALAQVDALLLSISRTGEMLLAMRPRFLRGFVTRGTLARASLTGGGTREFRAGIQAAEWGPDGSSLATVRDQNGRARLEYPEGTVLYETGGWIASPRFSPDGRTLAFIDHPIAADDSGKVCVIDLSTAGHPRRVLSEGWVSIDGLAWNPRTREIWFTATRSGNARSIQAVSLSGRLRLVMTSPRALTLRDVSESGDALFTSELLRVGLNVVDANGRQRDASWLDWSLARDLSEDGRLLLFNESGEGGGKRYGVYLRDLSRPNAVRLGEGSALALAPDHRRALVRLPGEPTRLGLLSTAAGQPVVFKDAGLQYQQWASWFPDGRRFVFTATSPGHGTRLYVQDVSGNDPVCLTPGADGVFLSTAQAVSPEGDRILAVSPDDRAAIVSVQGGGAVPVEGAQPNELPIRWSHDGREVYVYARGEVPARVFSIDTRTGRRTFVRTLAPDDPTGVTDVLRVISTPDASRMAFSYTRELSDLFLVTGLR